MNENQQKSDELLRLIKKSEAKESRAKLRVFFGMSAGVGKTYTMLKAAHQAKNDGKDIVIGIAETHGRIETEALLHGLEIIPKKKISYRENQFEELNIDAILDRKPEIVIVDELAHTNIPGSRHNKRYLDVLELLDAGIDVYTAINVQHVESRKETIEKITGISMQETVPDSILDRADLIELIDISPSELIKRLKEGKVYLGDKADYAQRNFFKEAPLSALREIALRLIAERVDHEIQELTQIGELRGPLNINERLMVAISHSPYSERLIRSARRIAFNLEAPWIAVHVDIGMRLSDFDETQLRKNIELARKLGAHIVTIVDNNLPAALSKIARQYNVSQIIIGRPLKKTFKDFIEGGSLLDQLVKHANEIDIHVIHNEEVKFKATTRGFRFSLNSPVQHYIYSFIFVMALALLSYFLQNYIGYEAIGFIFLLGVLLVSLSFNFGPIVFTAIISTLTWNLLFIPPIGTFHIYKSTDFMICIVYFIAAAITGILTNRVRNQQKVLRERGEKTQVLYEISRTIVGETNIDNALTIILKQLEKTFSGNFFIIKTHPEVHSLGEVIGLKDIIDDKEWGVAKWVFEKQQIAGWSTDTLPSSKGLYLPLKTSQSIVGILVYTPEKHLILSQESFEFLYTIGREIALALEKDLLIEKSREVDKLEAYEKLHQALLSSISHELKTPLTTIIGTAGTILSLKDYSQTQLMQSLMDELLDSAEKLKHTVENLLDMTRIQSKKLTFKKECCDIRDLINSIISKNQRLLKNYHLDIKYQADLSLVWIDSKLFEQALANIILNAANYSPVHSRITIKVNDEGDKQIISINDEGKGIQEIERDKIYDKFYRINNSPSGGTGLGLYISKEIFDLHSASITVVDGENHKGSKFIISLPIEHHGTEL